MSEKLRDLLLARPHEIAHPDPGRAISFGLTTAFATIESAVLFGETRSDTYRFSDDELAAELTHVYLAYLGIPSTTGRPAPQRAR